MRARRLGAAAWVAASWLTAAGASAQVRVSMSANRTEVGPGEQVAVRIEIESEGGGSPQIQLPSFAGFQIVSQQVQRPMQFSFSFGSRAVVRSSTNYTFGLQPVNAGRIAIDPVRVAVDGKVYTSRPLEITVAGAGGPAPGAEPAPSPAQTPAMADAAAIDDAAFLRTVVDKAEPYVGEQITVTIYLYVRQQLRAAPAILREPGTEGFWTRDLLAPDHNLQPERQVVRGAIYAVYLLRRFAAFPLRSGDLAIGAMSVRIDQSSMFDLFAPSAPTALERTGVAVAVHARALPEQGRPGGEVAVGRFELTAALDRNQVVTGDAVTLKATVRGEGNLDAARLAAPVIDGVEVLQPEIKDLVESPQDLVGGTRTYAWLLVPKEPGPHTVPPLVLYTFEPQAGRYRTLSTEPLPLVAAGQAIAAPAAPEASPHVDAARTPPERVVWPPIRPHSSLRRKQPRLVTAGGYHAALALPPVAWLSLVLAGWVRRRVAAHGARPQAIALRDARRRLANALDAARRADAPAFHAEAAAAVTSALRARLGAEAVGLTRPELRAELVRRGAAADLADAVIAELDHWDFARFGSVGATRLTDEAARLNDLFRRVDALALPEVAA